MRLNLNIQAISVLLKLWLQVFENKNRFWKEFNTKIFIKNSHQLGGKYYSNGFTNSVSKLRFQWPHQCNFILNAHSYIKDAAKP